MTVRIVTDSTADFSADEIKKYNIEVVPLNVIIDGNEYKDGVDLTHKEFYEMLATANALPTTSQPAPSEFVNIFTEAKKQGDSVVTICISSEISGTYQQSALLAKQIVEYDEIFVIDSRQATLSQKIIVLQAIKMRDEGFSAEEIYQFIESNKERAVIIAYVDTLEYLVKGGRLPKTVGFAGKVLGVKPIVTLIDGKVTVKEVARGKKSALQKLLQTVEKLGVDETLPFLYGSTYPIEIGEEVRDFLMDNNCSDASVVAIGTVIGTHAGPGAAAFAFFTKKDDDNH